MPTSPDKATVSAVIPLEIKERLKVIAKAKRWSISQTAGLILEECISKYEDGLKKKREKSPSKSSKTLPDKD
jgi:predicted DNA-binding protein